MNPGDAKHSSRDLSRISLAHGNGGRRMRELIEQVFRRHLHNDLFDTNTDAAILPMLPAGSFPALTSDGFTVDPLEFPGGDIGSLAINGTVNDLAVSGAEPLYIALNCFIEEGFERERLERLVGSMAAAARASSVKIVTGDTKVLRIGEGGGLYLATTGLGFRSPDIVLASIRSSRATASSSAARSATMERPSCSPASNLVSPGRCSRIAPVFFCLLEVLSCSGVSDSCATRPAAGWQVSRTKSFDQRPKACACSSTRFRCAVRCRPSAICLAIIRSTWPVRAGSWLSLIRPQPNGWCRLGATCRAEKTQQKSASWAKMGLTFCWKQSSAASGWSRSSILTPYHESAELLEP